MNAVIDTQPLTCDTADNLVIVDGRYVARIASSAAEIESALKLRHRVFNVELGGQPDSDDIEQDPFDLACRHLIVTDSTTGETVGTYRVNSFETAVSPDGFYSFGEFSIEDLPEDVLKNGVEVGRACIAEQHRNTKVLYLLWKGLAKFMQLSRKRYLFGCRERYLRASVFST